MANKSNELQILGISISLQLGKGREYWRQPNISRYENFEMPFRMFNVKALAELIAEMVKDLPAELQAEIAHFDAEQEAKEEAARQEALEALTEAAQSAGVVID